MVPPLHRFKKKMCERLKLYGLPQQDEQVQKPDEQGCEHQNPADKPKLEVHGSLLLSPHKIAVFLNLSA